MTILLVGSSIFEAWTRARDLAPGHTVVNRAVGGTTTRYWVDNLAAVLDDVAPDAVMYYCGSNDLNEGIPGSVIVANVAECRAIVDRYSPACIFAYFSIIKAPQKIGKWEIIDRINSTIRSALRPQDLYVETNDVFFRDGRPVGQLFVEDGLHLTDDAYVCLSSHAQPIIADWVSRRTAWTA